LLYDQDVDSLSGKWCKVVEQLEATPGSISAIVHPLSTVQSDNGFLHPIKRYLKPLVTVCRRLASSRSLSLRGFSVSSVEARLRWIRVAFVSFAINVFAKTTRHRRLTRHRSFSARYRRVVNKEILHGVHTGKYILRLVFF
jgi:hypothetical protein